jgi:DNA-binding MarR family transcriptional regulator
MKIFHEDLKFIQPNRILRELLTLLFIDADPQISQHRLAKMIGVSSAMANTYIRDMNDAGWIERMGQTNRCMRYYLTPNGRQRKAVFLNRFSKDISRMYSLAKWEFEKKLMIFFNDGLHRVVFFGAADAGELVFNASLNTPMQVLAIVDNDARKHSKRFGGITVSSPELIETYHPDGVIITTFGRVDEIVRELAPLSKKGMPIRSISQPEYKEVTSTNTMEDRP